MPGSNQTEPETKDNNGTKSWVALPTCAYSLTSSSKMPQGHMNHYLEVDLY